MIPKDGTVELIDNDSDGRYDTVKLTEYETYFVKSVNHNDYSVLTQKGSLHFDKNVVCILDNKPAQWSNIGAAQIISVYAEPKHVRRKIYGGLCIGKNSERDG